MQRNDLLFLALVTALAAIASAPPMPRPDAPWNVAEAGQVDVDDVALQISLAPLP